MTSSTRKWIRTAADERAAAAGCHFDEAAAARVAEFFRRYLRHSKGQWADQPFELLNWQRDDVAYPLFGWKRPDGTRRFRKAYVELPKKNGKSTLAAGIGLYMLAGDKEAGAECYSAATDQKQASIVHGEACNMVDASPELSSRLAINRTTKSISFPATQSVYRALSAGPRGQEGLNAHCIIADELHCWYGRELWDALKYAFRSRRQGLLFVITTAGDDMLSVCREQHDYAAGVLAATIEDDRYFAYIRAADAADDWTDPAAWRKANPSLGITINESEFAADVAEAQKSPVTQSAFKRYSLNIWSTSTNPWLRPEDWAASQEPYTQADLAGQECFAGLDLASTQDMTALVLLFRDADRCRLLPYFWLPEDAALDNDAPEEYRVWAKQGHLRTTPGNVCDYGHVERDIAALAKQYKIRELAYDPYNAEQLTQSLADKHAIKRFAFPQTMPNFAGPTREFERLLLRRELRHNGHPVLTWQAGHVNVYSDANANMRPVKPKRGDRRKIDGIVAAIMALARAMLTPANQSMFARGELGWI
jgi:phage terminase large subunit-like protein